MSILHGGGGLFIHAHLKILTGTEFGSAVVSRVGESRGDDCIACFRDKFLFDGRVVHAVLRKN